MKKILGYFQNKLGGNNLIKERYILLCILSIFVVVILLFGSTYSLFSASNVDEDMHVYETGNLDITYELSEPSMILSDSKPTSIEDSVYIKPYRITINNVGNVAYKFNLILNEDTAINSINHEYIMTQVGMLDPVKLSDCSDGIIKSNIIIPANDGVVIDVRVWLSDTISNTEMGKSFYAKLSIDGIAVHNDHGDIDNSKLRASYQLLSEVEPGSYVRYLGNNGCGNTNCDGTNANSSSTSNGYCYNSNYKYNASGWRIAYIDSGSVYLISGGAPECLASDSSGNASASLITGSYETTSGLPKHKANLEKAALKYCNAGFTSSGTCDSSSTWFMKDTDYTKITGGTLSVNGCFTTATSTCGNISNDLIKNGGYYWINHLYDSSSNSTYYNKTLFGYHGTNISHHCSEYNDGVRPVIKLDPSVVIVDGTGTRSDPYVIENPSTIRDLSGNMNNGVPIGSVWDKKEDTLTTDGVDDYVNIGLIKYNFGNSISLVTRVNFKSIVSRSSYYILSNTAAAGAEISLTENSLLYFCVQVGGTYYYYYSNFKPELDTWYTISATYDGNNMALYVNGDKLTLNTSISGSTATISGNIAVSPVPFYLGANAGLSSGNVISYDYSNLIYDDVLIYDRALSESEVADYFSGEITEVSDEELLVYYDFKKMASHVYVNEAKVESVTDGVTSYYATLDDALDNASASKTTNIKLLESIEDNASTNNTLEDVIIDLNGKTLTGSIKILNSDAKVTLKNGTVTGDENIIIDNYGELLIEDGNYYNTGTSSGNVISNSGNLTIEDGLFSQNMDGTTISNKNPGTLTMTGGTVNLGYSGITGQPIHNGTGTVTLNNVTLTSNAYGFVNTGGTADIKNSTISTTSTSCWAVYNRSNGTTRVRETGITTGANAYKNDSGTVSTFDAGDGSGKISGIVSGFSSSMSDGSSEVRIHGMSSAHVAVWTDKNGQDDVVWSAMNSYTGTYGTYLYYRIYKSAHNNETGTYYAHLYNTAHTTFYGSYTWTMN